MSHTPETNLSRRNFLKAAGAAGLMTPLLAPGRALGLDGALSPNERLQTVLVGYGNRGRDLLGDSLGNNDFQLVGVCDCFQRQKEAACARVNDRYKNQDCKTFDRYEDALDWGDVDVIINATPDHWHTKITIEACRAGKDVYCEKPLTLTPIESRQIVKAARQYNRIVTGGSQRVMEDYGYMAPVVQSGAIGEVKEAYASVGNPPIECWTPAQDPPEGLDWDRWLGQAPWVPYNSWRCSGSYGGGWRVFLEYGNGFLADWGAHKFAGVLYIVGLDAEEPVWLLPPNCEENPTPGVVAIYKNGFKLYHARGGHDITLVGSEREFRHGQDRDKIKPLCAVDVRRYQGGCGRIMQEFGWCVKHRVRPFQDVVYPAAAATLCQLMALCYRMNRKLQWDAATCSFVNDPAATRMVSRVQRYPYQITME
ncbi:MAG: Gfo/Idh/MocA family oxidoreductase [Planctomycetia bacterium]|nr:Gfo/Idh/MocA family oxidoreductase [Planctomycetia bacterium]